MPKGAEKEIEDIALIRYACYLIAQNDDSRKQEIKFLVVVTNFLADIWIQINRLWTSKI